MGFARTPYPFPIDHWRMAYSLHQAVRLELARLLLDGEEAPRARALLAALAAELPEALGEAGAPWRSAWLAKRFPQYLLQGEPAPMGSLPAVGIVNGGFEQGEHAWMVSDPNGRPLERMIEREGAAEGDRCLRIAFTDNQARGDGLPYVAQSFQLPAEGNAWSITLDCRAREVPYLTIEVYAYPEGDVAEQIGVATVNAPDAGWTRQTVHFRRPPKRALLAVQIYAGRTSFGSLWLDDVRLERVD